MQRSWHVHGVPGTATWTLFAAVLLLRAGAGWRGRKAAYGTIAGFSFAVLVLLVVACSAARQRSPSTHRLVALGV